MRALSFSISRKRLAKVLRASGEIITPEKTAKILNITRGQSSLLLSCWNKQGRVKRVQRGLYIPIPLTAESRDVSPDNPSLIAMQLFAPCYIGGWSALEYWGMTEQLFHSVMVMTNKRPKSRNPKIDGMKFKLKTVSEKKFFGLKTVWMGKSKIQISDLSRTVADMLDDPQTGGGIRPVRDVFQNYLESENKDIGLLMQYCRKLKNKTAFKRLGLLLEMDAKEEIQAIKICKSNVSRGYSKLDPALNCSKIITRWKLSVPPSWLKDLKNDR